MIYFSRLLNQVGKLTNISYLSLQCLDLNNSYKSQIHEGDQDPGEEDDEQYVPHHEELLERGERASLETSAVYVDPNTSTNL